MPQRSPKAASRSARRRGPRRVVVTGIGAVSAFGAGVDALWKGCLAGRTVVEAVPAAWSKFSDGRSPVWSPLGAAAHPESPLLGRAEARRLDPAGLMAMGPAARFDPPVTGGAPSRRSSARTRSESSGGENGLVR